MDPKANITEQLRLASRLQFLIDNNKPYSENDIHRLTELVIALNEWQSKGGFSPYRGVDKF